MLSLLRVDLHATDSTQLEVKRRLATHPVTTPLLVVAREQGAGRGRLGRSWFGAPGHTLMFSLWLPTQLQTERVSLLSLAVGASLVSWLEPFVATALKWPNDLLDSHWRKVAGILCEANWRDGRPLGVIAGVGINVSWPGDEAPADLADQAAALADSAPVSFAALDQALPDLHAGIESWHQRLLQGEYAAFADFYSTKLAAIDRPVLLQTVDNRKIVGYIEGVSTLGQLLFREQESGLVSHIHSGELSLSDRPTDDSTAADRSSHNED